MGGPALLMVSPASRRRGRADRGLGLMPVGMLGSSRSGCGAVGAGGELGADLADVWVVQVVEDGQGLLPGVAGIVVVADGVAGVAEAVQGAGLGVVVAGVLVQGDGLLVAG